MSIIRLDTEHFLERGLSRDELLLLLWMHFDCNREIAIRELLRDGFADINIDNSLRITNKGYDAISKIVLDSDEAVPKESKHLLEFANSLRYLFPKGLQQGKYPWRGSGPEIEHRLRIFYRDFGSDCTEEEIYQATERYVARMENEPYMRTLPYFLWDKREGNYSSLLASEIEMMREGEDIRKEDWRTNVI